MGTSQIEHTETGQSREITFLIRLRNTVFGENDPDNYTKFTFYMNLVVWFIFFIWSIVSYYAISLRQLIFDQKGIPVELIIKARGEKLGFEPTIFLEKLLTFHSISIICWISVFIGLVLIWRKSEKFIYFFFGGTIFYFAMILFYLSFNYYLEDTTTFDKIAFLAINVNALMYYFLLRKEKTGGSISFFGEEDE